MVRTVERGKCPVWIEHRPEGSQSSDYYSCGLIGNGHCLVDLSNAAGIKGMSLGEGECLADQMAAKAIPPPPSTPATG